MVQLLTSRYAIFIFLAYLFICLDLAANCLIHGYRWDNVTLAVIFVMQVAGQLLAILVLSLCIFHTNVFQSGLVELLLDRFRGALITCGLYLVLTIVNQALVIHSRWKEPRIFHWPVYMVILHVAHRLMGVIHFYVYKRAMLRVCDPRYYDLEWVKHALGCDH